jgi:CRISPR-associated endonuclease/helicase Cas3
MPDDARELIEGVFGGEATLPDGLQQNATAAEGCERADTSVGQQNALKLVLGYARGAIDWWSEAKTPSRLGEPTVDVVLARWEGEQLRPWIEGPDGWAYSTVRVPERLIAQRQEDAVPARESVIAETLLSLPSQGRWSVLLPLRQTTGGWTSEAWSAPRKDGSRVLRRWRYDKASGLAAAGTTDGPPDE